MSTRKKPVNQRTFNRPSRKPRVVSAVPQGERRIVPRAPSGLRPAAQLWWREFFSSELARYVDLTADREALTRWAFCVSERDRLEELLAETPMSYGAQGQPTRHPLWMVLADRIREIEKFREHFGATPLSRMRLGIVYSEHDEAQQRLEKRRSVEPTIVEVPGRMIGSAS